MGELEKLGQHVAYHIFRELTKGSCLVPFVLILGAIVVSARGIAKLILA